MKRSLRSVAYARPALVLLVVLAVLAAWRGPTLLTSSGMGGALVSTAPLILAAMAVTPIAMSGRGDVNLAIGPLMGLINVVLIQLVIGQGFDSPVVVIGAALVLGVGVQSLLGFLGVMLRVEPIIVALGGYLAISGLNLVIMPRPGGVTPEWLTSWASGRSILSPVLGVLIIACLLWWFFTKTALYTNLRLAGTDERAAYVSGIPTGAVHVAAHGIGGVFAALAALCFTALIGSGDPNQGSIYTLLAVTALVLGGTSLAGGVGGMTGSVIAAIDIFLISYVLSTFQLGSIGAYVNQFVYGAVLVAAMLTALYVSRRKSKPLMRARPTVATRAGGTE